MILSLAFDACSASSPPDSGVDDSVAPAREWTTGRSQAGRWLDVSDSDPADPWALRDDGLVLANHGEETYGSTIAPFEDATLCTGIGAEYFWPPCILAGGAAYYSDTHPIEPIELPGRASFLTRVCWNESNGLGCDSFFACSGGGGSGACTDLPASDLVGGLAQAAAAATVISGSMSGIVVATGDQVFHGSALRGGGTFWLAAVEVRQTNEVWALDKAGGVWLLDDDSGARSVAERALRISGDGLWEREDLTLWGPEGRSTSPVVRGPDLPGFATKLAGDVHRGCALIEHDLWCWTDADDLPFPGVVSPVP